MAELSSQNTRNSLGSLKSGDVKPPDTVIARIARVPTVSKIFFGLIWLQASLAVMFRVLKFQKLSNCQTSNEDEQRWILSLSVVLIIFVLYFGMNAVVKEKSVELFAFIIAAVLQLLRTAYEYVIFANTESVSSLMLGDVITNVVFVSIYIPLVFFVKKTFGWLFFRVVGGDMQMRSVYVIFEVFVSIQKFSVLITLMFCLTALVFLFRDAAAQAGVSILFIFSVFAAAFGVFSVKLENRKLSLLYALLQIVVPIFAIWTFATYASYTTELDGLGFRVGLNQYSLAFSCDDQDTFFPFKAGKTPQQMSTCTQFPVFFSCRAENMIIQQTELQKRLFEARSCSTFSDGLYSTQPSEATLKSFSRYAVCNLRLDRIQNSVKTTWIKILDCPKAFNPPDDADAVVRSGFGCLPVVNAVSNAFWRLLVALVVIIHFASMCCLAYVMRYFGLGLKKLHGNDTQLQMTANIDSSFEIGSGYYGRPPSQL